METLKSLAESLAKVKNQIQIASSCLDECLDGDQIIIGELSKDKPDYRNIELVAHQQENISDLSEATDRLNRIYETLDYLSTEKNNANK